MINSMKCLFLVLEFKQIKNVLIFWISQIPKINIKLFIIIHLGNDV